MPRARDWVELLAAEATAADLLAHREHLLGSGEPPGRRGPRGACRSNGRRASCSSGAGGSSSCRRSTTSPSSWPPSTSPTDLLQGVVHEARRLLGVDLTYLALLDGDALRIDVASGQRTPQLVGVRLPADAGLIGRVAASNAPMWTPDYATEKRIVHRPIADDAASAEGLRGLLGVPLAVRGRVIGALLAAKRTERHFTEDEVALLQALASQASVAIDNARSREQLARSNAALQQALRLDEQLTTVVLEGGDLDVILALVRSLTPGELAWVATGEPAPSPAVAAVVEAVGDGGDGMPVGGDGLVAQPVLAAKRLLGVLVATTADEDRDATRLVLERAAPIIALTIAEARQAARASELGRDIATIDLVSRREGDARLDRERMRGAGLDPRRPHDVIVVDDPTTVPALRQALVVLREATSAAYRDQAVLLVRHRTDWAEAWPAGGPVAGLAGPVSGALTFRDAYLDAARTARALAALGRRTGIARSDDLGVFGILLSHTGPRELAGQLRRELGPLLAEERRRGVPWSRPSPPTSRTDSARRPPHRRSGCTSTRCTSGWRSSTGCSARRGASGPWSYRCCCGSGPPRTGWSEAGQPPRASRASRSRSAKSRCCHSSLSTVSRHSETGKTLRRRPARPLDRLGLAAEATASVRPSIDVRGPWLIRSRAQSRAPRRATAGQSRSRGTPGSVGHLVPGQVERVPRRRVAEDGAAHPGVGGEDEVSQRLDERPLGVHRRVQLLRGERCGPASTVPCPEPLDDVPRLAEPGRVGRAASSARSGSRRSSSASTPTVRGHRPAATSAPSPSRSPPLGRRAAGAAARPTPRRPPTAPGRPPRWSPPRRAAPTGPARSCGGAPGRPRAARRRRVPAAPRRRRERRRPGRPGRAGTPRCPER